MATPIHVPRINNNDDEVKVLAFDVVIGDKIENGQIIGQVETDKAVLDVTASCAGYVLGFVAGPEEVVKVGSVMLWLGESAAEKIPKSMEAQSAQSTTQISQVTAKARILLKQSGLRADVVPLIDGRVTVEAVERYLAAQGSGRTNKVEPQPVDVAPDIEGVHVNLTREEKGMAATVTWHRDFAVPGYIEIEYGVPPWVEYARQFQEEKGQNSMHLNCL